MRRATAATFACAIGLGCVGAWASTHVAASPSSSSQHASSRISPAGRAGAVRGGRLFLSSTQVHQAMVSGIIDRPIRSLLASSAPLKFGDYSWNDAAVPSGPTWIRVDLRTQLISVFRSGHEIGTAVIVYGGENKETPVGKLHILGKARDHRSSLYDAPMPYTLRLTNDGVSIHGSSVRWGAATHGCIGVPLGFARRLFEAAHVGDDVVIVPASRRTV